MSTAAPAPESTERFSASPAALPLGERLLQIGALTPQELETALTEQRAKKTRLGETLIELGFVDKETLLPILAEKLDVPFARLREGLIDPAAVKILPRGKAESLKAIALFRVRDELTVAMADPQNLLQIDELQRITNLRIRPALALGEVIEKLLPRAYEEDFAIDNVAADLETDAVEVDPDVFEVDLQDVRSLAEGSPVINLVNYIIVHAVRQHASDIHIEPGTKHSSVRFRIDGQLREVLRPRRDFHAAIVSRIKVISKLDIAEHRLPQDGRTHVLVERREIDMRCSTLPTVLGEKVVLRVLDRSNVTFDLEKLGVPRQQLEPIKGMLRKPYGLVLVTGPTGSGKTTTLYSAVELIKSVHRNIVTVEDPVEYQLEMINQVQTERAKSLTFASVLRAILRQDPDVIMVGEIRDAETAEVAIQAGLTGHLVLSTLHTNDSASVITRLLDMGIAPYKISAALVGIIAQRLVRTVCQVCRTTYYPTAEFLEMIRYTGDTERRFVRGEGCQECYDTGFQGRVGIYEIFRSTARLRAAIAAGADLQALQELQQEQEQANLLTEGIKLAEAGKTSLEEVVRVAFFD